MATQTEQILQQLAIIQNWIDAVNSGKLKISDFDEVGDILATDLITIMRSGVNKKMPLSLFTSLNSAAAYLVENYYDVNPDDDIDALLADQVNQTEGKVQFVADASDDPSVDSGPAYYEYLDNGLATLSDYRKLSAQEVSVIQETVNFRTFVIDDINGAIGNTVPAGRIEFEYDGSDKVVKILFDQTFTKYLKGLSDNLTNYNYTLRLLNKTTKATHFTTITAFTYTTGSNQYYEVDVTDTIDRTLLTILDTVEVIIDASPKQGSSTKESFTATAAQTEFVLSNTPTNVEVFKDRMYQLDGIDYNLADDTVTFTSGVLEDSIVTIRKYF